MSEFLDTCMAQARVNAQRIAFCNSAGERLTYGELAEGSDSLAAWLQSEGYAGSPVAIYGHKGVQMLTCMFACMKAGSAYVPVDTSFPPQRMEAILSQLDEPLMLCTVELDENADLPGLGRVVQPEQLQTVLSEKADEKALASCSPICGDDAQYILFTSGSTGTPKGVVQRAQSVDLTSRYFSSLLPQGEELVCFNRAPFSFDLSLFDFLLAIPNGHTMFALDGEAEASLAKTFEALGQAGITVWVSTPSYLAMCLSDPSFGPDLLPKANTFLMCGETLLNATAAAFYERFPQARLINMYGPTETCGAVTDVVVTPAMAADPEPLPVGHASPYSEIQIVDPQTLEELPLGQQGEMLILGETAASGYHRLPQKTADCFFMRADHAGNMRRCYRTGDAGFLRDGILHYRGRFDLQLKVNGYRIELGDIEENLQGLPQVAACCVVPVERNGSYTALAAHVALAGNAEGDRKLTKALKDALKEVLPGYMVPRTFTYYDELPTNANGKIDRKALTAQSASRGSSRK